MSVLSEIILDGQERALSDGVRRHLPYDRVSRKAFVCIGVRRCGKSTLLDQIMAALIAEGIPLRCSCARQHTRRSPYFPAWSAGTTVTALGGAKRRGEQCISSP